MQSGVEGAKAQEPDRFPIRQLLLHAIKYLGDGSSIVALWPTVLFRKATDKLFFGHESSITTTHFVVKETAGIPAPRIQ